MIKVYVLNEITIFNVLVRSALGYDTYVLEVSAHLPIFNPILSRAHDFLTRFDSVKDARVLAPEMQLVWDYPLRTLFYDVFGKTEAWHNNQFGYSNINLPNKIDVFAYKQVTCNYMKPAHIRVLKIDSINKAVPKGTVSYSGIDSDTAGLFDAFTADKTEKINLSRPKKWLRSFINFSLGFAIVSYSVAWILSRTRLGSLQPKNYFLGADFYLNPSDFKLYDAASVGGDVLLVKRNRTQPTDKFELAAYDKCEVTDGRFDVKAAILAIQQAFQDTLNYYAAYRTLRPAHYYLVSSIIYKRAMFHALFHRFKIKHFWCRDEYNVEHILRREQLNRIGGKAYGVIHGFPTYTTHSPMWHYISFDTFYVHSSALYNETTKKTWDENMIVSPVGSFNAKEPDFALMGSPRSDDIVIYTSAFVGLPTMVSFVRQLATEFPERTIFLQLKKSFSETPLGKSFFKDCIEGLTNVKQTNAPLFELLCTKKYGFSDPSSVVIEGLQFGQYTFFADLMREQVSSILRDYPEICVRDAHQAAARIRAIEAGDESDFFARLSGLVHFSKTPFIGVFRKDIGLTDSSLK